MTSSFQSPQLPEGSFRDSIATISKEGKRQFLRPKKPKGKHYRLRSWFSLVYLFLFFIIPFIKVYGEPLLMFNVLERKFILFGMVFWPQDFFIFGLGMLTFVVFVTLFTIVFGRVFCGWACPQTIFMEMVFRKIEYWIDGDAVAQKKLKAMSWNGEKIRKRLLKLVVFLSLSFLIANFFLAYLISMDQLLNYIKNPSDHLGTLFSLSVFTLIFFFVYWWFREQACIVVCPYGRLQGVLLDKQSIVVAYDHVRGEPRGVTSQKQQSKKDDNCKCVDCKEDGACKNLLNKFASMIPLGDCVDCGACVRVCPTGIDIRNGTQLECINCTACMDACDSVMFKLKKPLGLIRYASEESIKSGKSLRLNARIKAYSAVLFLLIAILVYLVASRQDLDIRLFRTAGMTYTTNAHGEIRNLYHLKLINKTHKPVTYRLNLEESSGKIEWIGNVNHTISRESDQRVQFFVNIPRDQVKSWKQDIHVSVFVGEKKIKTMGINFLGPEVYN